MSSVHTLILVLPMILIAISVHEMMHALVAYWLGDNTAYEGGRVSLNPLRHIDPILTVLLPAMLLLAGQPAFGAARPVMVNVRRIRGGEYGWALVAVAGPLTNLVLAGLSGLLLHTLAPAVYSDLFYFLYYGVAINVGFFVFNLIPWPPLDGSRLLYAFAPRPLQELMEQIERWGIIGLIIILLVVYPLISPLITHLTSVLTQHLLF